VYEFKGIYLSKSSVISFAGAAEVFRPPEERLQFCARESNVAMRLRVRG